MKGLHTVFFRLDAKEPAFRENCSKNTTCCGLIVAESINKLTLLLEVPVVKCCHSRRLYKHFLRELTRLVWLKCPPVLKGLFSSRSNSFTLSQLEWKLEGQFPDERMRQLNCNAGWKMKTQQALFTCGCYCFTYFLPSSKKASQWQISDLEFSVLRGTLLKDCQTSQLESMKKLLQPKILAEWAWNSRIA